MTDPLTTPPALPRAHILSYVASADSPTRVRKITAGAVAILAFLHAIPALLGLSIFIWNAIDPLLSYFKPPVPAPAFFMHGIVGHAGPIVRIPIPRPTLLDVLRSIVNQESWALALFLIFATLAAVLYACAKPIGRGKKVACITAMIALIPLWFLLFIATMSFTARGLLDGIGIGSNKSYPIYFLLLIPAGLTLLLFMLLNDLNGYLRWIAKNPITEIPPVTFLPTRSSTLSAPPKIQ